MVRITWQGLNGQTYSIAVDATLRQQHSAPSTVTDHPVETGSNISDHIRPEPDTLTLEGIISNTPIRWPDDHVGESEPETRTITVSLPGYDSRSTVTGASRTIGDVVPTNLPPGAPRPGHFVSDIPVGFSDTAQIGQDVQSRTLTAQVLSYTLEFNRVQACYDDLLRLRNDRVLCTVVTSLRTYEQMGITTFDVPREAANGDALRFSISFKHVRFGSTKNEPLPLIPVKKVNKGTATKEEKDGGENTSQSALRKAYKFLFGDGHKGEAP